MRPAHYQFVVDANGGHWKVPTGAVLDDATIERAKAYVRKFRMAVAEDNAVWDALLTEDHSTEPPADFPTDFTHNRAREVIRDVLNGSIGKGGRRELRKALDTKDAPPTREQARDEALNRALRLNR